MGGVAQLLSTHLLWFVAGATVCVLNRGGLALGDSVYLAHLDYKVLIAKYGLLRICNVFVCLWYPAARGIVRLLDLGGGDYLRSSTILRIKI